MADTKKKTKKGTAQSRLRKMIDFADDHPVKKKRKKMAEILKMMDS